MSENPAYDLIVVGGGAAGFMAAITAKTQNPKLSVLILEAAAQPLGKVKISGGGRCNVTHACFDRPTLLQAYPRGGKALHSIFSRFSPQDTINWFASRGVILHAESDGRMFPTSNQSQSIIDCLRESAHQAGVILQCNSPVQQITPHANGYTVYTTHRVPLNTRNILLASGGNRKAYTWLPLNIIEPVPSLFTFNCQHNLLQHLSGISFSHVNAKLQVDNHKPLIQAGPLLITHWGLSGPVILKLSAWGARLLHKSHYHATLYIDFVPSTSTDALFEAMQQLKTTQPNKALKNTPLSNLPKRFWENYLADMALDLQTTWRHLGHKPARQLTERLKNTALSITGKGPFKEEFVTAGGIALNTIDTKTMAIKALPGVYAAGEILDIDGITGGFNFQNAWATGYIAGHAIANNP